MADQNKQILKAIVHFEETEDVAKFLRNTAYSSDILQRKLNFFNEIWKKNI